MAAAFLVTGARGGPKSAHEALRPRVPPASYGPSYIILYISEPRGQEALSQLMVRNESVKKHVGMRRASIHCFSCSPAAASANWPAVASLFCPPWLIV